VKRAFLLVLTLLLLVIAGCVPQFLQSDNRVQVVKLSEGVYRVARPPEYQTSHATRINSSAIITAWEPREGCTRVVTEVGGMDKALKCVASPVTVNTFGTLDVGLVR
jgi:hypothetical protein